VLVIASALSVQDVRDRPMDAQQQADQAHAKFDDEKSEFTAPALWNWLETPRLWKWINGPPRKPAAAAQRTGARDMAGQGKAVPQRTHKLSNRQYEQLLRQNFISVRRVREWRDIHTQLHTVVAEHKWHLNTSPPATSAAQKRCWPGCWATSAASRGTSTVYLGARGIKFHRHPGAHLSKKPGRWIVVAELVETTRLFGRGIANIEPQWLEQVGGHLLKKQLLDPHWEKKAAEVVALERATLYGMVVYNGRRVNFGGGPARRARDLHPRGAGGRRVGHQAAVPGRQPEADRQVEELEHKSRRQDVLVDDELIFAFYDQQVPADVCSGRSFERWYRDEVPQAARTAEAHARRADAPRGRGHHHQAFPKTVRLGGVDCAASYLHEPGDPATA
jgi:ATP-dependent helicase HrpA